jgi:hypothetical protein
LYEAHFIKREIQENAHFILTLHVSTPGLAGVGGDDSDERAEKMVVVVGGVSLG